MAVTTSFQGTGPVSGDDFFELGQKQENVQVLTKPKDYFKDEQHFEYEFPPLYLEGSFGLVCALLLQLPPSVGRTSGSSARSFPWPSLHEQQTQRLHQFFHKLTFVLSQPHIQVN